jgi:hypothetical protein
MYALHVGTLWEVDDMAFTQVISMHGGAVGEKDLNIVRNHL